MRYLISIALIVNLAYGQTPCFPSFDHNYQYINHFEFNSLFNIKSGENGDYTVYSIDEFTTSVSLGGTYSMQVASEYTSINNNRFKIWIDYDNDGTFASDEVVLEASGTGTKYEHEMITIPTDASYLGVRRVRVMMANSTETLDPCGSYYTGEAEDYFITITDSIIEPCYCTPFIRNGQGSKIEDVNIRDLLNCNSEHDPFSYYTFYPDSVFTVDLAIGQTYRMLVSKGTNAGPSVGMRVNIDYNDDHMFDGETVLVSPDPGPGIVEKYITIPDDTSIIGQHRMRVRISSGTPTSLCTWASGETEDYIVNIIAQDSVEVIPEWQKIIEMPFDQMVRDIVETYDSGFAMTIKDELSMDKLKLVKLSIDGDTLWTSLPPFPDNTNYPYEMDETHDGGFIICGVTDLNDPWGDPYALKLDACGGLQWRKTYGTPNNYDVGSQILQASDSNFILLNKYLTETSRIALFKLDSIGNIIWQNDYTHHFGSEPSELIETSDKGFLITGDTYTPNPGDSSIFWARSMLIKIDSEGNEEWEKVLGITDTTLSFGYSSVELESGGYLVTTTMIELATNARWLGVYRVDESGNLLFYKTVSGKSDMNKYGKFIRAMDNNKYCIVTGIYNGCYGSTSMLGLFMIDENANVLDSAFVNDYHLDIRGAVVTENNRLLVSGSKKFPNHEDMFMFKFTEDLEFDTLYNMYINYDWICDIIIYEPELPEVDIELDIYPNPTCRGINVQINGEGNFNYLVEVMGMNGAVLRSKYIPANDLEYVSLEDLGPGMYILGVSQNNRKLSSRKIIKAR